MSGNRQRTTSFVDGSSGSGNSNMNSGANNTASSTSGVGASGGSGMNTNRTTNAYSAFGAKWNGKDKDEKSFATVIATPGSATSSETIELSYYDTRIIGNGSFGIVYQARLKENDEVVAIKKVLQDKRFKNRELQIMKALDHCNIVKLKYYFYSVGAKKDEVYLNLLLEFIPETVYKVAKHYSKSRSTIPMCCIKLYMYQLFRSLAYIHSLGICHRDIKPQNLLLDPESGVLKLCDFGSAKILVKNEPNVSYICSRYYRAPELIFGAINYTTKIDTWSAGCVFAELLMGQPIFPGDSSVDQLVEIIKVLGTPSRDQIFEMNPSYTEFKFPQIRAHPWPKVFRSQTPSEAIKLVSRLLEYVPAARMNPAEVCIHPFFDELRNPNTLLPNGRHLPPLFNFTEHELRHHPQFNYTRILKIDSSTSNSSNTSNMDKQTSSNNNIGHHMSTVTSPNVISSSSVQSNIHSSTKDLNASEANTPAITPSESVDLPATSGVGSETTSGGSTTSVFNSGTTAASGLV